MTARPWIVLKFGGTSVARAQSWQRVRARVDRLLPRHRVWIVASAVAGVSNALEQAVRQARDGEEIAALPAIRATHLSLAEELGLSEQSLQSVHELLGQLESWLTGIRLTGEAPPRLVARVMSVGELLSTTLGQRALRSLGLRATWVDARQLLCSAPSSRTSEHHDYLEARVSVVRQPEPAERAADGAEVVITQGFIARTPDGDTCLLGRGGSDTSGALFAALLDARELEIWTDVPGLFTADPRLVPTARLIRSLGYREAQELAAMGAKVLHPRCLAPAEAHEIPISVHWTDRPDVQGTRIETTGGSHPAVTAVTCRTGVTLLSLSTLEMWEEAGFLARVFAPFDELGVSVDLLATSQSAITMTLDRIPGGAEGPAFDRLLDRLQRLCRVTVVHPCAVVSIVGRRIRAVLAELGTALAAFQERPVHLVSDSAEDLNLSFVVDERDARALVARLHEHLFAAQGEDGRFGPTWELLGGSSARAERERPWWHGRRGELIDVVADGQPRYVYDLSVVAARAAELSTALGSVDRFFYSMKANPHPRILETLCAAGFGLECVSVGEVRRAREVVGNRAPLLFTPNFCPAPEYAEAAEAGAEIVIDGPEALDLAPETFAGSRIGLRIDPGHGLGHHEKVRTAGPRAKFGHPADEADRLGEAAARVGAFIVGLHAHIGSGILDAEAWAATGRSLASLLELFGDVRWLDLGGGLGVPERPGQRPLDLGAVDRALCTWRATLRPVELRLEPGRFLVSAAGVLVSPVTQVRTKRGVRFVGLATGMNSLIRPALYGAWHGIHNLSRLDESPTTYCHVVGPICETGDVLGLDRLLPDTRAGDVVLIENAGAYGAVMGSRYNLRPPASEVVLTETAPGARASG